MTIIPRTDLAIEFLLRWKPGGPWILSAAAADRSRMNTKVFYADQIQEMTAWIENFQDKRNLYFIINTVRAPADIKPSRVEIAEINVLHVDCDPRAGEDFSSEQVRILKSLQNYNPHPSAIVASGAGYQAFWFLEEPIVLDGTEACAIDAERYSQQLELVLGADRCSNADRLMRIPGTINIPNDVKIRKGRVKALAELVEWEGTRYPLGAFIKAPTRIQKHASDATELEGGGGERVSLSNTLSPIYLEDLSKAGISIIDNVKVLIVQGHDPDDPNKYASRSEALWAVVCALAKTNASDDMIAGVIMNKDNAISASVLDKPNPAKYAARQIQNAREEAIDPALRKLNARHAVIQDLSGKCRVISEVYDHALKRPRVSFASFEDFKNRYLNMKVVVAKDKDQQDVFKPAGQWWLAHPQRRQYETIIFAPGKDFPEAYNLWQGFACEAIPGNCDLFLEHVKKNICSDNQEYYHYICSWMARCTQQPDCPGEVALVLRGEMGTGKGVFSKHFGSLFGRHFMQVSDPKHLVGSFNSHLRDCIVLFGDEAFYAGDKKHESVLRSLVTESTLTIEQKGVDVFASPNYTHIILASNSAWVVPAGSNERRFFVLDVSSDKMQDKKYFAAIEEQMNRGGREALLHFLLEYDITGFEVRDVPKTLALQDQKLLSYSAEEGWWFEKLEEGRVLREHDTWECEIMKNQLQDDYINYMVRTGIMRKANATVLGKFLGRVCPGGVPRSYQKMTSVRSLGNFGEEYTLNRRMYFYELPKLEACREKWDKEHGGPFKWQAPLEKQEELKPEEPFK